MSVQQVMLEVISFSLRAGEFSLRAGEFSVRAGELHPRDIPIREQLRLPYNNGAKSLRLPEVSGGDPRPCLPTFQGPTERAS